MKNKIIIDVIKEFNNSNIIKRMKVKYKKLEIELEKDDNTKDNDILYIKDIKNDKANKDEKWIFAPIVRKILQVRF